MWGKKSQVLVVFVLYFGCVLECVDAVLVRLIKAMKLFVINSKY